MSRPARLAVALALLFVGVWATTAAFAIKFTAMPLLLGPALAFSLLALGVASLVWSFCYVVLVCAGDE